MSTFVHNKSLRENAPMKLARTLSYLLGPNVYRTIREKQRVSVVYITLQ